MLLKTLYSKDSGSKSVPRIIPKVWDRYKVLYFLMFVFWCVLGVVVGVVWVLSTSALYVALSVVVVLLFRWHFFRTKKIHLWKHQETKQQERLDKVDDVLIDSWNAYTKGIARGNSSD